MTYSLLIPIDCPSSSGSGAAVVCELRPQPFRNWAAGDMEEPDILLDLRLVLRKLAVRDKVLFLDSIGQGSLPMLGLTAGEGDMTAFSLKYEPEGVSGLLNCSLSREPEEADVKEGRCACVVSFESIVSSRGATSLLLVRRLMGSPVNGLILGESSGAAGAEADWACEASVAMQESRMLLRRGLGRG